MSGTDQNTVTNSDNQAQVTDKRWLNLTRKGLGRPKGSRNRRTVYLEEMMPGLKDFLDNFPASKQGQVKNYLGFRNLLEAADMVDLEAKPAERFSRRLQIVDRTLPRSQEVNVTSRTALITGKLETLLKLYDQEPNDNKQIECIDVSE